MKKIIAVLLALTLILGLGTEALAVSWAAPATSSSASPFAIEVIKLQVNSDVTGAKYYTTLTEAAAYNYSTIYYAIKLSVPSYANANAYYGNSGFLSGSNVKVTINYTNISGKSSDTVYVALTDAAQTLFWNGSSFDASWVSSVSNSCGCGDSHILSATSIGSSDVSIKACVGASGKLSDITIDGCYTVKAKTYYGVKPCVNCSAVNLSGFLFNGSCAMNGVFFSTNAAGKVTGIYALDSSSGYQTNYLGSMLSMNRALFGWAATGVYSGSCYYTSCGTLEYGMVQLPADAEIYKNYTVWNNTRDSYSQVFDGSLSHKTVTTDLGTLDTWNTVYYLNDLGKYVAVTGSEDFIPTNNTSELALDNTSIWSKGTLSGTNVYTGSQNTDYTDYYVYSSDWLHYLNTYYQVAVTSDAYLYKMTSATTVNCDTNEATYLNSINHVLSLLGFTYADVAAGTVYMTEDILLANFGFSTSVCHTATWGAYTSTITVTPIAEVPATGSVSIIGLAAVALSVAAGLTRRKLRG